LDCRAQTPSKERTIPMAKQTPMISPNGVRMYWEALEAWRIQQTCSRYAFMVLCPRRTFANSATESQRVLNVRYHSRRQLGARPRIDIRLQSSPHALC
jgi:hypothetical protein